MRRDGVHRELASVLKPTGAEESFLLLKGRERLCSPIFNPFILNMKRDSGSERALAV